MRDPLNELRWELALALSEFTYSPERLFVDIPVATSQYRAEIVVDALVPLIREALARAWDEGLDAGCDRWMDAREFGDPPVTPYRERS